MTKKITTLVLAAVLGISTIGLAACSSEGPAEKAGKKVDNAGDSAGDAMDKAGDKADDATNN